MKQPDDPTRAGHILDAAETILRWIRGKSTVDFSADDVLQSAVVYQLQIIGEAGAHLSSQFRRERPNLPRQKIIRMRYVLALRIHRSLIATMRTVIEISPTFNGTYPVKVNDTTGTVLTVSGGRVKGPRTLIGLERRHSLAEVVAADRGDIEVEADLDAGHGHLGRGCAGPRRAP